MNLALGQNDRYLHYILAIWEGPLCVTAELIEMVQYLFNQFGSNAQQSIFFIVDSILSQIFRFSGIFEIEKSHMGAEL